MIDGRCNKPGCSFDHSMKALDETREDLQKKLERRAYAATPTLSRPPTPGARPVNAVLSDGSGPNLADSKP